MSEAAVGAIHVSVEAAVGDAAELEGDWNAG
jgi:hypothetical protein